MHKTISVNKLGRDFVVGDIHGAYDLLMKEMRRNGFDTEKDRLFSVGDIIDRGQNSRKCLELLDKPWFIMVLGNHEQMMIDSVLHGEGYSWVKEYGKWSRKLNPQEREEWALRLSKLPVSITLEGQTFNCGICHAEPDGTDWVDSRDKLESRNAMIWGRRVLREAKSEPLVGVDISIHGHTPLESPKWVNNRYFMDTGAWYSNVLTFRKIDDIHAEYAAKFSVFGL